MMTESELISVVRCILYATGVSGESEVCNKLLDDLRRVGDRQRRRTKYMENNNYFVPRGCFVFAIKGQKLC